MKAPLIAILFAVLLAPARADDVSGSSALADSLNRVLPTLDAAAQCELIHNNYYALYSNSFDEARTFCEQAIAISKANNLPKHEAKSYLSIAVVFYLSGDYEQALANFQRALSGYEAIGDKAGIGATCNEMANYYKRFEEFDKAAELLNRSEAMCTDVNDLACLGTCWNFRGVINQMQGKLDTALACYLMALDFAEQRNDDIGKSYVYNNLAGICLARDSIEQAVEWIGKSTAIREANNDMQGVAINNNNVGEVYLQAGDFEAALPWLEKSLEQSQALRFTDLQQHTLGLMSKCYFQLGNYDMAMASITEQMALKDSLLNVERVAQLAALEVQYDTAQKERDLAKATNQRNILVASLALFALLAAGGFTVYRARQQQRQQAAELAAEQQRLQAAIKGQESERQRIAKDLHDGIGQQLSGLKLAWSGLANDLADTDQHARLEQLTSILDESCTDVRNLSHQMMPRALQAYGLTTALADMLQKSLSHSSIEHNFDHFGLKDRYPEDVELSLFRVAQELINNVIKHSQATSVDLQVFENNGKLLLIVEDNGIGFEPTANGRKGHGLLNMESRLRIVNGSISFEKGSNGGTVSTVRIPVSAPA